MIIVRLSDPPRTGNTPNSYNGWVECEDVEDDKGNEIANMACKHPPDTLPEWVKPRLAVYKLIPLNKDDTVRVGKDRVGDFDAQHRRYVFYKEE